MITSTVQCHLPVSIRVDIHEQNDVVPKMVNEILVLLISVVIVLVPRMKTKILPKRAAKINEMQVV